MERVRAGDGGALVVRGQAAGGKSALADRAERYARELGVRVLRLRCPEPGGRFGALAGLVAELAAARKSLSALHGELLGAVLERPPTVRSGLPLRQAVLALLEAATADAPLLLVADDSERLDEASRSLVEYAAYRFGRRPLGLLATQSVPAISLVAPGATAATGTAATIANPGTGTGLRGLPVEWLPPLDAAAAAGLLADRGIELGDDQLAALLAATGGHATALLELAPLAATGDFEIGRRIPVPLTSRLAALVEPRLAALDARTRHALLLLAASQTADMSAVVGALRSAGSSMEAFEAAEAVGVVVAAPVYRFEHPLLRSAVYHAASQAERADAHRRLAAALAQRVRPTDVGRRAWHRSFAETPPDAAVAAELATVGRQSLARRRLAPAREAFARAAAFAPDPMERAALLTEAARCARLVGRAAEASAWLTTARELLRPPGDAQVGFGPDLGTTPDHDPLRRLASEREMLRPPGDARAEPGPGHRPGTDPDHDPLRRLSSERARPADTANPVRPTAREALAIRVEAERARLDRYHGDVADAFVRCDRMARDPIVAGTADAPALALDAVVVGILAQNPLGALAVAEWARPAFADDHELLPVLRILTGYLRIVTGDGEAGLRELQAGTAARFDTRADPGIHAAVYAIRGFAMLDQHAEAQTVAYKALRLTRPAEACGLVAPLLVAIADADVRAGRWSAALEHALEAAETAQRLGQAAVMADAHATAAWVTALRDEWGRARIHLARAAGGIAESGGQIVNTRFVVLAAHAAAEDAAAGGVAGAISTAGVWDGWRPDASPDTAPVPDIAPLILVPADPDAPSTSPARSRGKRAEAKAKDDAAAGTNAAGEDDRCDSIAGRVAPILAEALDTLRDRGIVEEAFQPLRAALVNVLLAAGDLDAARRRFAEGEAEPTASPSVRAARARIAALLVERDALPALAADGRSAPNAATASEPTPASKAAAAAKSPASKPRVPRRTPRPAPDPREAYEQAVTLLTPVCDPFEAARTRLAYGTWLHRARRLDEARPHLDQAAAEFRRLGAHGWAARVDAEVGAALRAVREAGAAERFSDREREIAGLVASGMTDKQAAAALFLSPRTIEYHLRSLYRKLGIRTRTQLAAIVAEWGGGD